MSKQINHEIAMMERGTQRFYEKQDKLRDKGHFDQTYASTRLIKHSLNDIAAALEESVFIPKRGLNGKYNGILRRAAQRLDKDGATYEDWHAVAYIGVQALFQSQSSDSNAHKVSNCCARIATRLEADLKCRMFAMAEPAYYNAVMQSFEDQAIDQYQHKHRVMMLKFNEFGLEWEPWGEMERIQIAIRVLHCCLDVLGELFFTHNIWDKGKRVRIIETTVAGDDWLAECEAAGGATVPLFEPCIAEPMPWTQTAVGITGGYHHPKLQTLLPFIKVRDREHTEFIKNYVPQQHMDAINKMQATKWQVNKRVYDTQREVFALGLGIGLPNPTPLIVPDFPEFLNKPKETYTDDDKDALGDWKGIAKHIHGTNKINKGKVLAFHRVSEMAAMYLDTPFHFVYNCDFRGRIYCATSGLTPQGEDLAKGLLHFHKGVRLGESGINWLAVQAANVYGNDKITYPDRVHWLRDLEPQIKLVVADPISNRWWADADKPWQFLAALYEWSDSDYGRNEDTLGHLAVGLDGSCNGIQHYSAMLRDSVGGGGVNLYNTALPSDIYQEVATQVGTKLHRLSATEAALWQTIGLNRKLTKRPVMTLPYGSTQQSCRAYIYEYILDNRDKFTGYDDKGLWELAKNMTPLVWESIGEVVIAAREAMDWLQGCTKPIIDGTDKPISWLSPVGFPVWQRYLNRPLHNVQTELCGGMQLTIYAGEATINRTGQRNGIAPNFIHSVDNAHMVKTINNTGEDWSLAMIHDDFGTHAGHTQRMYHIIREQFVDLYEQQNPLLEWYYQQMPITSSKPFPGFGDLDIRDVLKSTYFFG